jgi:hypothetical protein
MVTQEQRKTVRARVPARLSHVCPPTKASINYLPIKPELQDRLEFKFYLVLDGAFICTTRKLDSIICSTIFVAANFIARRFTKMLPMRYLHKDMIYISNVFLFFENLHAAFRVAP